MIGAARDRDGVKNDDAGFENGCRVVGEPVLRHFLTDVWVVAAPESAAQTAREVGKSAWGSSRAPMCSF